MNFRTIDKATSLRIYGNVFEIKTTDGKYICIHPEDVKMISKKPEFPPPPATSADPEIRTGRKH